MTKPSPLTGRRPTRPAPRRAARPALTRAAAVRVLDADLAGSQARGEWGRESGPADWPASADHFLFVPAD